MSKRVRYLVEFVAAAGVHQSGDRVVLAADDYQREAAREKPRCILIEEWHEQLDGRGDEIVDQKKIVPAPPPAARVDAPALASENAALKAELADVKAKARAAAEEGGKAIADLQAEVAALKAKKKPG